MKTFLNLASGGFWGHTIACFTLNDNDWKWSISIWMFIVMVRQIITEVELKSK